MNSFIRSLCKNPKVFLDELHLNIIQSTVKEEEFKKAINVFYKRFEDCLNSFSVSHNEGEFKGITQPMFSERRANCCYWTDCCDDEEKRWDLK